jgi:hypothetical protein
LGLERKLVTSWLSILALGALTLAFALLAPGMWSKSARWVLPAMVGVSAVLALSIIFFAMAIALRMSGRFLKRKRR